MLKGVGERFREGFRVRALDEACNDFFDPMSLRRTKEWLVRWRGFMMDSSERSISPF